MTKVLVIEDDIDSQRGLVRGLRFEGFDAAGLDGAERALERIEQDPPDLVTIDLLLPGGSGQELLSELRARRHTRTTPIIVVTGVTDRTAFRSCMELGADDFITKPFGLNELIAAIHAQLRKRSWLRDTEEVRDEASPMLAFGNLTYDQERRCLVTKDGHRRVLTVSEARLMKFLLENSNRVLGREALLQAIGRPEAAPEDRSIDVLVGRLRRKVESDPRSPKLIQTVRSIGYVLSCVVHPVNEPTSGQAISA